MTEPVTHEVLAERIEALRRDVDREGRLTSRELKELEARLEGFVERRVFERFESALDQRLRPLERVVYGLIGLVLVTVAGGLLGLVIVT